MKTKAHILYPPGGILLWIIIFVELLTFSMASLAFAYYGNQEKSVFSEGSAHLSKIFGTINTLVLITSGYFVAKGVHFFRENQLEKFNKNWRISMIFGFVFLVIKGFEYYEKLFINNPPKSLFFNFYWLMTGFHYIHVIVGLVILFFVKNSAMKQKSNIEDVSASAAFWHMCDLIWLIIFPMLYLVF